uniref:IRG-type G domain-containing protein n=1 Tax=Pelodiscus sinensis TaxID=13735 RepID=K7FMT8_PELSI
MSEKETEEIKAALETGDLPLAAYVVQRSDELLKNTELNIAITGESGAGKSSFLNALRGLSDEDQGAAETGVTETTKQLQRYQHSKYPNVIFWDLPGIGTPDFLPATYLRQVMFNRYDFFIIIASDRFRANHALLAPEARQIRKMGKKFYFVRSKVDVDLYNENRKKGFCEEKILEKIRKDCIERLSKEGISSPRVFLVSSREFQKYEFPKLQKKLLKELDSHKKHLFLMALPNLSQPILEKKKKLLQGQIWKQALKSCAIATVPLPMLSVRCDVDTLVDSMRQYCESFGLDDISLNALALQVRKRVEDLKSVVRSPLAKDISKETAETLLRQATERSFTVIYRMLNSFLNGVAEDAQRVLVEALAKEEEENEDHVPLNCRECSHAGGATQPVMRIIVHFAFRAFIHASILEEFETITDEEIAEIREALEGGSLADAASKILESLESLENTRLDIAVTGESGSGKSSFINAILSMQDEDEGAAPTGVVETTTEPTPYPHPTYPNVTLWDLPGIGTPAFQSSTYLEQVGFARYDFFIVLASERFRANHAQLAREIQQMGKRFYFVRSKVDADLAASKMRRRASYSEHRILEQIRNNCCKLLQDEGVASPTVFLLSSWELGKYDFQALEETLEKELPSHKRHAFLMALPNLSLAILQRKKEARQKQIWKLATISCGIAAVPIPGLSVVCDVTILVKTLSNYRQDFGLDDESLCKLAERVGKPVEDIKEAIQSPLAKELSKDLVVKMLTKAGGGALMFAEYLVSLVPVVGSMTAGAVSFGTTYYMLHSFLNELARDA